MANSAFRQQILMPLEVVTVNTVGTTNKTFVTNAAGITTVSMPAAANPGDAFAVGTMQDNFQVTVGAGQTVLLGGGVSSVAGTITSQAVGDSIYMVCIVANTTWLATAEGILTVV